MTTAEPAPAAARDSTRVCVESEVVRKAAPATAVEFRRAAGFALAEGFAAGAFCAPGAVGDEALVGFASSAARSLGVDPDFVVVLTEEWPGCDVVHYVPVANDVRGLGYARTSGVETFDQDSESRLLGVAFLNDVPYWIEHPEEHRSTFLHELGHRWGARVHALRDGVEYSLTGRQSSHWSYFFESFDSPLEGNRFRLSGDGWLAEAAHHSLAFSPLDLYLMGVRRPEEVPPFRFFPDGAAEGEDCRGNPVGAESGPQWCEPKLVSGAPIELSVDDVVSAEGERSAVTLGQEFEVLFVVASSGVGLADDVCAFVERSIPVHVADFRHATESGLGLRSALDEGARCEDLVRETSGGCAFASRRPSRSFGLAGLAVGLGLVLCRCRRLARFRGV